MEYLGVLSSASFNFDVRNPDRAAGIAGANAEFANQDKLGTDQSALEVSPSKQNSNALPSFAFGDQLLYRIIIGYVLTM